MADNLESDLRYPIGRFKLEGEFTDEMRQILINEIEEAPANLRKAVEGLTDDQLNTSYRPGGWTVKQVVHHLPDSHLNSYIRFKLALTEDEPLVKTYFEERWAELKDSFETPVSVSINLFENLHIRWVKLLKSLSPQDFKRSFRHPEHGLVSLERTLAIYAYHGKHHVAQINSLRKRMGW